MIIFNGFKNIEYLAKDGFGEVYKATWDYYGKEHKKREVVLKRIYNSSNKIVDILKEVRACYSLLSLKKSHVNLRVIMLLLTFS